MKNKKAYCNSTRKKSHKSRELKCSDSGDKKHSERRHSTLQLNKEEADSSSGKEFQKSKFSHNTSLVKKLCETKKGGNSDSLGTQHARKKTLLSKKQSLRFKSYVIKILNKFKISCSEYELMTEHVKWEYFNEELLYQESAYHIVKKLRKLINDLKMEIEVQDKKLVNFYEKWNKNCSIENTDHEDSSSSGSEDVLLSKNQEKIANKSKSNSKEGSVVSECDNKEIFSDSDTTTKMIEKMSDNSSGNSSRVTSPILGSKREKIPNKINVRDNSKPVDSNERVLKESHVNENKKDINKSVDDMFEESMTENVSASNISKSNENEIITSNDLQSEKDSSESKKMSNETVATENDNLEIESKKSFNSKVKTTTTASVDSKETSESVENDKNKENEENKKNEEYNSLNGLDQELDSDQETVIIKEHSTEKSIEESQNYSPNEKSRSKCKEIKSGSSKEQNNKKARNSSSDDTLLDETIKDCAKRAHLDSNSDDSIDMKTFDENQDEFDDNSDEARAKAKLLISSNAESLDSSFDSDSDIESTILNTSTKSNEITKNSVEDVANFNSSVDEGMMKRQLYSSKASSPESDEKLNNLMVCQVVIERPPNSVLIKHANALEKSRQYLESKRIKRYKVEIINFSSIVVRKFVASYWNYCLQSHSHR